MVDEPNLQDGPVSITLFRIEVAPGAGVAFPPGDAGLDLHLVESGTPTLRGFDTDIVVTRAANEATPDAESTETLAAGAETTLQPGDGFMWPPFAASGFTNEGTEPVVLLISNTYPPQDAASEATPAACPARIVNRPAQPQRAGGARRAAGCPLRYPPLPPPRS
ncbi:MAG: hypothetical protein QM692_18735 [Thermomicrobiales bacterium]